MVFQSIQGLWARSRALPLLLSSCVLVFSGCTQRAADSNSNPAQVAATPVPLSADEAKLFKAIEGHDLTQVQTMVRENPQLLKAQGPLGTPLHRAAGGRGDAEMTRYLLDKGADVRALDGQGNTPLNVAVRGRGSKEKAHIVELLLTAGADPNAKTRAGGSTPLHIAAFGGNVEAVKHLIAHKADVNATDREGKTPLQRILAMQEKLKAGDKAASTLGNFFDLKNYPQIVTVLREAGGK